MDEGRKRVVAIIAGIIVARHLDTADDLFGGAQGSPRTDKMVAAAIQWAERIMREDRRCFRQLGVNLATDHAIVFNHGIHSSHDERPSGDQCRVAQSHGTRINIFVHSSVSSGPQ